MFLLGLLVARLNVAIFCKECEAQIRKYLPHLVPQIFFRDVVDLNNCPPGLFMVLVGAWIKDNICVKSPASSDLSKLVQSRHNEYICSELVTEDNKLI